MYNVCRCVVFWGLAPRICGALILGDLLHIPNHHFPFENEFGRHAGNIITLFYFLNSWIGLLSFATLANVQSGLGKIK